MAIESARMGQTLRVLRVGVLGAAFVACNQLAGIREPHDPVGPTQTACDAMAPFGPAAFPDGINQPGTNDEGARLSPDELTAYFHSDRGATRDIYVATRARRADRFAAPQRLSISSSARDPLDRP